MGETKKELNDEEKAEAVELYKKGLGFSTVALQLKASHGCVNRAIVESGTPIRSQREGLKRSRQHTKKIHSGQIEQEESRKRTREILGV